MPKPKPKQDPDEDDYTVVVDRGSSGEGDHTIVVDRGASPGGEEDHTIVVDRGASQGGGVGATTAVADEGVVDEADHTVVVARPRKPPKSDAAVSAGRRRGIAPPPVPQGFAPPAVEAIGPGAVDEYVPRTIPEPPPLAEIPELGTDDTREPARAMASVSRRSRRGARVTLMLFVAACIGAVVGLVAIVIALTSR